MFHTVIATTAVFFLAVTVYPADSQQRCTMLPIVYPVTEFDMQTCPTEDDIAGTVADINRLLRDQISPTLEGTFTGQDIACSATSCRALAEQQPQLPSGEYWVTNSSGGAVQVYCDLTGECCGGIPGGTRVGYLNVSDPTQTCPEPWREYQGSSLQRACGRMRSNSSSSVFFSTDGVQYSRVCGRIIGYQFGGPEAFQYAQNVQQTTLETNGLLNYVDGVSITYGYPGPRMHIWTFAAGRSDNPRNRNHGCPCITNYTLLIPEFVQDDYFCESGTTAGNQGGNRLYDEDPLWDGEECASADCCQFNNPPWFCKQLNETVSGEIEVRIITFVGDVSFIDTEDTPIALLELYVQ